MNRLFSLVALVCLLVPAASAQQRVAYVDTEYIFGRLPEYQTVQQQLNRQAQQWEGELQELRREVDELFREYQARELLYTSEERQRRRDEIVRQEEEIERLRTRYFGPEGEYFTQQETLMRPLQERLLEAIEAVAEDQNFDYVFDKGGDYLFLFARPQFDLSDRVLEELGVDVQR